MNQSIKWLYENGVDSADANNQDSNSPSISDKQLHYGITTRTKIRKRVYQALATKLPTRKQLEDLLRMLHTSSPPLIKSA